MPRESLAVTDQEPHSSLPLVLEVWLPLKPTESLPPDVVFLSPEVSCHFSSSSRAKDISEWELK